VLDDVAAVRGIFYGAISVYLDRFLNVPPAALPRAGSVNRKNGTAAAVAIKEGSKAEAPRSCINHVAASSWAETNVPDRTLAHQRRQNVGFRSANQVDAAFAFILRDRVEVFEPSSWPTNSGPAQLADRGMPAIDRCHLIY
jgi:hypothetical protein